MVEIGDVFNYWTVVGEPTVEIKPSGQKFIKLSCECVCGKRKMVNKYSLTASKSLSCGCKTKGSHRESGTRLYHCWENMKQRARLRCESGEICTVCEEWQDYIGFKEWAISAGYGDGMELLRGTYENPDQGDYEPNNTRWGTHKENAHDYLRKTGYR